MMSEIDKYDYELPKQLIAQQPVASRVDARLLVVDRARQSLTHQHIRDLPELLRPSDCLVLNDTRVVPARLLGCRENTGGHWEGLFLEADQAGMWRVLCKARGRLVSGEWIRLRSAQGEEDIRVQLIVKHPDSSWIIRPDSNEEAFTLLERVGRVPLPPYIRKGEMVEADRRQYQTVYARWPGAVAAPTAGLHFNETLLRRLEEDQIVICPLTLHTGAGTFRPISTATLGEHPMHSEWGTINQEAVDRIQRCRKNGGRVVAVGTTSVRLLETAAADGTLKQFTGHTDLFIRPPYEFRIVDAVLTNFHLPRTTLLVLVRTFGGDELIVKAYEEAVRENYRFFSYGDAMLIL